MGGCEKFKIHIRMKQNTLTIGIPAFNEEKNISYLIQDILHQNSSSYTLTNIIVASDGSSDETIAILHKAKNKKIIVIDGKTRLGQAHRQNQIINRASSDILILLNADIRISDINYINKLIFPILHNHADLVSSYPKPAQVTNLFSNVLLAGTQIQERIYSRLYNGDNIYTCHGRARAFSKRLYKALRFQQSVGEDAYSYLYCKQHLYKYVNQQTAKVEYKLPANIKDHLKQSARFVQNTAILKKYFSASILDKEFHIPKHILVEQTIRGFVRNPVKTILYLITTILARIYSLSSRGESDTWSQSLSSK